MPPAVVAVGGLMVAMAAKVAITKIVIYAVVGAAIGGIMAAVKGGNILEGALMGAGTAMAGAGIAALAAPAAPAAPAATGATEAAATGATEAAATAAGTAPGYITEGAVVFSDAAAQGAAQGTAQGLGTAAQASTGLLQSAMPPPQVAPPQQVAPPTQTPGFFSRVGGWIEQNPNQAARYQEMIGGTIGGIGENWAQSNSAQKQADAMLQMQRERFAAARPDWGNNRLVPRYTPLPSIDQTPQYFEGLHPAKQGGN